MESASAAAAQCHYQSGRYHDALLEFDRCERLERSRRQVNQSEPLLEQVTERKSSREQDDDNGWITAEDNRIATRHSDSKLRVSRAELVSLPSLARRADMAMCRFRCVIRDPSKLSTRGISTEVSSSMNQVHTAPKAANECSPTTILKAWKDAIQTNDSYRRALTGAASSLIDTCFREMEHVLRFKNQQDDFYAIQSPSCSADTIMQNRKQEHDSIQNAMKSTAVAMLMAGVASCHLLLHDDVTPNRGGQHSDIKPWNVLVHTSIAAAGLLSARSEFIQLCSLSETTNTTQFVRGSTLKSSMHILNEYLNDERSSVALHSFRVAVKVAALACGKLVLPKVALESEEKQVEQRPSKRQKQQVVLHHRREIVPLGALMLKNDVWNTVYRHGDVALRSRESMVDALSFHLAATHCSAKRKKDKSFSGASTQKMINEFFQKKEVCIDEAILWESNLNALCRHETFLPESFEYSSGYVWKICSFLRGLDIIGGRRESNVAKSIKNCNMKTTLNAINRLALSSTSKFACEMMGCIHVQNREYSRAIEMFRLSLERGERSREECSSDRGDNGSSCRDIDTDVEMNYEFAEHRAISNMASCFVAMGDANTPLELLLHLWTTYNESNGSSSSELQPRALLLSCTSTELEKATNAEHIITDATRKKLLWMLFHVSSLASDWATCLAAAEKMAEHETTDGETTSRVHIAIAYSFALLQCRRDKQSQRVTRGLTQSLKTYDTHHLKMGLVSTLTELYFADGALMLEKVANAIGNDSPAQCTHRAMTSLDAFLSSSAAKDDSESILELRAIMLNNNGIASLVEGDACTALRCFREASELIACAQTKMNARLFWLLIPTHFNLSLLCLRDGRIDESAGAWLSIRGYLNAWESAKKGDHNGLSSLRANHLMAMNRHGLIMAKRNVIGGSSIFSWDQKSVMEWVPPVLENQEWQEESVCIHGVDSAQVSTLDFILLMYALSVAEKKSSSLFRRKAGHVGY
ncbi:hypothetical protein ACHAW6_004542 [Cyclotella cf. meneghiniana]